MTRFADSTEVASARSRDEIELTLIRYGADQFMCGWQGDAALVGFQIDGRRIKFVLPLPARDDRAFTHHSRGARTAEAAAKEFDQAVRQRWRALALSQHMGPFGEGIDAISAILDGSVNP